MMRVRLPIPGGGFSNPGMVPRSRLRLPNPFLSVLGNPGGDAVETVSKEVVKVDYVKLRDPDGNDVIRYHRFKPGVRLTLLKDGRAVLWHPTKPIWENDETGDQT